ncbi:hypothetical protein RQP46_003389 [Phenoliferia psychrophenolica]
MSSSKSKQSKGQTSAHVVDQVELDKTMLKLKAYLPVPDNSLDFPTAEQMLTLRAVADEQPSKFAEITDLFERLGYLAVGNDRSLRLWDGVPKHLRPKKSAMDRITCQNCGEDLEKILRCSRCNNSFYCNAACQKIHWPIHKTKCSDNVRNRNHQETMALKTPKVLGISAALQHWCSELVDELNFALVSSLRLFEPARMHTTHTLTIQCTFLPDEPDASICFRVDSLAIVEHAALEAMCGRVGMAAKLSQHGLNTHHGMQNAAPPQDYRCATFVSAWHVTPEGEKTTDSASIVLPNCVEHFEKRDTPRLAWEAFTDRNWAESFKKRSKVSANDVFPGSFPAKSTREVHRYRIYES